MLRLSAVLATLLFSATSYAQCLDWVDGRDYPGQGFSGNPPTILGSTVWNDGSGEKLLVSTDVSFAGSLTTKGISVWDGVAWNALPGSVGARVNAFVEFDDGTGPALYGAGPAVNDASQPTQHVAKFNGTGWVGLGGGAFQNGEIACMCVHDDGSGPKLYVGGTFTSIGGTPVQRIARWTGSSWQPLLGGVDAQVRSLCSFNGNLYVGGQFLNVNGVFSPKLAMWNGTSWNTFPFTLAGFGLSCIRPFDLGDGTKLYLGGSIDYLNGSPTTGVFKLDGTTITPMGFVQSWPVQDLRLWDDGTGPHLFAAGTNGTQGATQLNGVGRWNGASWDPLGSGIGFFQGAVALWPQGGFLHMLGPFVQVGGKPSRGIASWGAPCSAPSFVQHPVDVTAVHQTDAYFRVTAYGTQPFTYQWRRNGVPIANQPGREGCLTATLRLYYWSLDDAGTYDCVVTGPYGSATSNPAVFTVPVGGVVGSPVSISSLGYPPTTAQNQLPNETLTNISAPMMHTSGGVELRGVLNNVVVPLRNVGGVLTITHRPGDPAPDIGSGVVFGSPVIFDRSVSTNDQLAFVANLSGSGVSSTNNSALYFEDAQGTNLVARKGAQAPGLPAGWLFTQFGFAGSMPGEVDFWAVARSGTTNKTGIWRFDRVNGTQPVAIMGVPSGTNGVTLGGISNSCRVWPTGDVFFDGSTGAFGLWASQGGAIVPIFAIGDPLPGYPGHVARTVFPEVQSVTGDIYIAADADPGSPVPVYRETLFVRHQGQDTPLIRHGDVAPTGEPGATFSLPRPLAVNANGDLLVYSGVLTGSGCTVCPTWGLWLVDSNGATPVALSRPNPWPGAPPTWTAQGIGISAMNSSGQVIFNVAFSNNSGGVYGWTRAHGLFPITVPGSQVDLGAAGHRTVDQGSLSGAELTSNPPSSVLLSDSGRFALTLLFTDGSRGAFEGSFAQALSSYFGAGTTLCSGDSSGTACPCGNDVTLGQTRGCLNSLGLGGALSATGVPSVSADSLRLVSSAVPSGPGLYFQGTNALAGGGGVAFGDGLRCAGGSVLRLGIVLAVANASSYPPAGSPTGVASTGIVVPGDVRYYQVWYRDATPGYCTVGAFNLTNAVRVNWLH